MFTGIIETLGRVVSVEALQGNLRFTIEASFTGELRPDESVSHNGVCLTITNVNRQYNTFEVTAIEETLTKTNLGTLKAGDFVNLERAMPASGRFDGHVVQGHVDQTGVCTNVVNKDGSWVYTFEFDPSKNGIVVEKGSICVNGISLTVINAGKNTFSVAIIPYTYEHTNIKFVEKGAIVNLEFDILGKYIQKILADRFS